MFNMNQRYNQPIVTPIVAPIVDVHSIVSYQLSICQKYNRVGHESTSRYWALLGAVCSLLQLLPTYFDVSPNYCTRDA